MDCIENNKIYTNPFYTKMVLYQNNGTNLSPSFDMMTGLNNPFDQLQVTYPNLRAAVLYHDFDGDNDLDFINVTGGSGSFDPVVVYENIGDSVNVNYTLSNVGLLDSTNTGLDINGIRYAGYRMVDIDADGDLDVFEIAMYGQDIKYYENMAVVMNQTKLQGKTTNLDMYPNPSSGLIHFKEAVNGRLSVYDRIGNLMKVIELKADQSVDLGALPNGLYMLVLDDDGEQMIGKFSAYK